MSDVSLFATPDDFAGSQIDGLLLSIRQDVLQHGAGKRNDHAIAMSVPRLITMWSNENVVSAHIAVFTQNLVIRRQPGFAPGLLLAQGQELDTNVFHLRRADVFDRFCSGRFKYSFATPDRFVSTFAARRHHVNLVSGKINDHTWPSTGERCSLAGSYRPF